MKPFRPARFIQPAPWRWWSRNLDYPSLKLGAATGFVIACAATDIVGPAPLWITLLLAAIAAVGWWAETE